jgi:hypothetical protein
MICSPFSGWMLAGEGEPQEGDPGAIHLLEES